MAGSTAVQHSKLITMESPPPRTGGALRLHRPAPAPRLEHREWRAWWSVALQPCESGANFNLSKTCKALATIEYRHSAEILVQHIRMAVVGIGIPSRASGSLGIIGASSPVKWKPRPSLPWPQALRIQFLWILWELKSCGACLALVSGYMPDRTRNKVESGHNMTQHVTLLCTYL